MSSTFRARCLAAVLTVSWLCSGLPAVPAAQAQERYLRAILPANPEDVIVPARQRDCSAGPPEHLEFLSNCNIRPGHLGTLNRWVEVYDEGISFSYMKDSIPLELVDRYAAQRGELSAIAPLLAKLAPFVGDIDRYGIEIGSVEFPRGKSGVMSILFVQDIAGHKVAGGQIFSEAMADGQATGEFSGFLVEPALPQLQSGHWLEVEEARKMAIDAMLPYLTEREAQWLSSHREPGNRQELLYIDVHRHPAGMTVAPLYRLSTSTATATVNLYDSVIEVERMDPFH